jgi:DNA-binding GntR family transcriptional regulator
MSRMGADSTETSTLPHEVYGRLRTLIVSGRIAPGTRLIETEVAERLAVSRTPVREAIRRLAHEGLAQVVKAGARTQMAVAPATIADLVDLFAIIGALEGVAGRGVERLTSAQRRELAAELTALNDRFGRFAKTRLRTPDQFFESHDAFHTRFVERCATGRLTRLIAAVRPQVKRYELLYANAVGADFSASLREHRAIVSAIRAGTPARVERAIRRNWSQSALRLSAGLSAMPIAALGTFADSGGRV